MPGLSGFETIPPLREVLPELVIVAYTGVAGEFVRKEMLRLDVPFVLKSSDGAALVDKLRELVRSA
jgi:DNA-binding NarL/FixJ family response regulator